MMPKVGFHVRQGGGRKRVNVDYSLIGINIFIIEQGNYSVFQVNKVAARKGPGAWTPKNYYSANLQ